MVSAINFNSTVQKGYISDRTSPDRERVVIMKREPDGFIQTSVKSVAYVQKAYVTTKEAIKGIAKTVTAGLSAGAAVLGLSWILQKAAGRGVPGETWAHPIKAVTNVIGGILGKAAGVFSKNTNFRQVLAYPFVGFPRDIFNYVKNANGCGKAGKIVATAVGLSVAAYYAFKTLININRANAEIDHGYRVGHNS